MLKQLVDRLCHETGPIVQNYRTSVSETSDDPFYEYVQVCLVGLHGLSPAEMTDSLITLITNWRCRII